MLKFTVLVECERRTYLVGPSRREDSGVNGLGGKIFVQLAILVFLHNLVDITVL